jgi:hypothetical protein
MEILIFKTNIKHKKDLKAVETILNNHSGIRQWNIDRADIDRVLRVVTTLNISSELARQIQQAGYCCEELPD